MDRNDWYGFRRFLQCANCFIPRSCDDVDPSFDQFGRILRNQIRMWPILAKFDRQILAVNKTTASQLIEKILISRTIARSR